MTGVKKREHRYFMGLDSTTNEEDIKDDFKNAKKYLLNYNDHTKPYIDLPLKQMGRATTVRKALIERYKPGQIIGEEKSESIVPVAKEVERELVD